VVDCCSAKDRIVPPPTFACCLTLTLRSHVQVEQTDESFRSPYVLTSSSAWAEVITCHKHFVVLPEMKTSHVILHESEIRFVARNADNKREHQNTG